MSWALYALTRTMAGGGTWAPLPRLARHWGYSRSTDPMRWCSLWPQPPLYLSASAGTPPSPRRRRPAPVVGSGQPRRGAGGIPARRPRSQRGTQLRGVGGRRRDCLARWAESLHRQPRSRRRDVHARAGHHSIDCRTGQRFDSRGGVEYGSEPLSGRGLRLLSRGGHSTGSSDIPPMRCGCGYARSGFCSTASMFHSTTVTRSTRASHPLSFASWLSVPGCCCRLAWSACSGRRCARTATGIGSGRCSSRCTEQRWSSSS